MKAGCGTWVSHPLMLGGASGRGWRWEVLGTGRCCGVPEVPAGRDSAGCPG